jgi:hypothetical protein
MAPPKFAESQSKSFEDAANPHQWFLSADMLHAQAVALHSRGGLGTLTRVGIGESTVSCAAESRQHFQMFKKTQPTSENCNATILPAPHLIG